MVLVFLLSLTSHLKSKLSTRDIKHLRLIPCLSLFFYWLLSAALLFEMHPNSAVGESLSAGFRLPARGAWPHQLLSDLLQVLYLLEGNDKAPTWQSWYKDYMS